MHICRHSPNSLKEAFRPISSQFVRLLGSNPNMLSDWFGSFMVVVQSGSINSYKIFKKHYILLEKNNVENKTKFWYFLWKKNKIKLVNESERRRQKHLKSRDGFVVCTINNNEPDRWIVTKTASCGWRLKQRTNKNKKIMT